MHLKNFSLITRNKKIALAPAYDLLNSTIAQKNAPEEIALPIRGRKNHITKRDFFDYFAVERLGLNQKVIERVLHEFQQAIPRWQVLIGSSFLSSKMQEKYLELLALWCKRLDFFI